MPDLLTQLRQRTRLLHDQLDAGIDFSRRPTLEQYTAFLRATHRAVAPLERALDSWCLGADRASRAARLAEDLERLGDRPPAAAAAIPSNLPQSLAGAFGCAYVLEGSSLGGLVVAKAIEATLGDSVPTSYLRLRGERTGEAWRGFLDALHAFDARCTDPERDDATRMAIATFEHYMASYRVEGLLPEALTVPQAS